MRTGLSLAFALCAASCMEQGPRLEGNDAGNGAAIAAGNGGSGNDVGATSAGGGSGRSRVGANSTSTGKLLW